MTDPRRRAAVPTGRPGRGGATAAAAEMPTMGMPIQSTTPDDSVTIGVAIEIPEPHAQELQRWRADFGDPLANAIPTHITLLPPTEIPPELAGGIVQHLADVAADTTPFVLRLRGTGSFRPVSPVVYVKVYAGAAGCDALQQRVRTGPLSRDLTFPYHPHVTVAHDLDEPALDRAQSTLRGWSADFTVSHLGLYEHGRDGVWRLRRRFVFPQDAGGANGAGPPR